jgi:hypothetical protein
MIIIVPLVVVLAIGVISVLVMILDTAASILGTEDVPEILTTLILVALIQGERYATGRVPTRAW